MQVDAERLRSHIRELTPSPRPAGSEALESARLYVAQSLESAGWSVEPVPFDSVADTGTGLRGVNLVAQHPRHPLTREPRICVGAHVDSVPTSPGADDNASAVATLLEIARLLPNDWPADPQLELELVAFDLEEYGMLGGAEHARRTYAAGLPLKGMVSLEMLGYCDHAAGSQKLPRALVGQYPETGNFIAVIGNQNSGRLLAAFRDGMQNVADLPVETLLVPDNGNPLQATRLSDHSPFWDAGYAALMITDTSFMRNPHYHLPSDTIDTLDMDFLQRVAQGCLEAVRHILASGL